MSHPYCTLGWHEGQGNRRKAGERASYIVCTTLMLHGRSLTVKVFCQLDNFNLDGPIHTFRFDRS